MKICNILLVLVADMADLSVTWSQTPMRRVDNNSAHRWSRQNWYLILLSPFFFISQMVLKRTVSMSWSFCASKTYVNTDGYETTPKQ